MRVTSNLDEETPYDLLIVTLLAHQAAPLLPALERSAASCIQFMFNTFQPERLQEAIGAPRCAFGMPVRPSDPGWRRPAQGHHRRRRPEDHQEPATLGGRVQRCRIALGFGGANASLASLPRSLTLDADPLSRRSRAGLGSAGSALGVRASPYVRRALRLTGPAALGAPCASPTGSAWRRRRTAGQPRGAGERAGRAIPPPHAVVRPH